MITRNRLVGSALLLVLSVYFPAWINHAIGRVTIDVSQLTRWADSPPLNNNCVVDKTANACEDVKIHYASNTAFLACGDPAGRTKFYPGAGRHDTKGRTDFREKLFKYDIKSKRTTELLIEGLDGDFVTHGLDTYDVPGDGSRIHLMAVRHARGEEAISIFTHTLGTDVVTLVKDVKHPAIRTPNGVAAVAPFEFYATNDHYYMSGDFLRPFEEIFRPWSWTTNVVHCDASTEEVQCRDVARDFVAANGIAVSNGKLFVGDAANATVSVFDLVADRSLAFERRIILGAAADNINVIPTTGDLVAAVFPVLEDLPTYLDNTERLGRDLLVPAAALRLNRAADYAPELLYRDTGAAISFMTSMAVDPYNGVAIGTGVLQYGGFAVCSLSKETVQALQ